MREVIRILQVVTHMNRGGLETMLMNYYRHVDRSLVQFDFLTHRDYCADYDDEINSLGGNIYHLPRLVPWSNSYKQALRGFFKSHPEYRIIHVHQDCFSGVICQVAKECGVPVRIAHSHCTSQDKNWKYPIKLYYMKRIPKYATDLLACGQKAGEWMFGGAPFRILNNAIDADAYVFDPQKRDEIRTKFGLKNRLVIGHIGRFSPPKNHPYLIDIFNEIHKKEHRAALMLVGDGDGRKAIEEKVKSLGLQDCVIFTGVRSDVPDLLQAMDAFVFPSNYEGLGIVAIEAQTAGLPCFLSDQVPDAACVTALSQKIHLKSNADEWSRIILDSIPIERKDTLNFIRKAGYDIKENAPWLQNYYIEQWKANT